MSERTGFSVTSVNPMAEIVLNAFAGAKNEGRIRQSLALAYWPVAAGDLLARSSVAVEVQNRTLVVRTKSSSHSQDISFYKHDLLRKLNSHMKSYIIEDIKCRTDGTPWPAVIITSDTPTDKELDSVLLSPEEHEMLRRALNALESVSETHTRQALSVRITTEAKLRHWRLEHGWRVCLRCSAVHKSGESICPICRLKP